MANKKDMKKFTKEFETFRNIWEDGRNSNPLNISEEFAFRAFCLYKGDALVSGGDE